ncbi:hypothetical protein [Streptomyces buecherae]|uniref:hypothetical protein n=1 Tax=Streptomyces buecherae TaxID=2763006 RepID=UPI0036C2C31F
MTHPVPALGTGPYVPLLLAVGVSALLVLALTTYWFRRRETRTPKRLRVPAVRVAALAALGSTCYSADTSWRFAADYLDMAGTAERAAMFAAAELALVATALMARQNLASQGAPGLPGTLVWVITGVQVIPAYAESGPVGGTVRAFVGPVMAATLWHLAMGLELRLRTPSATSHGLIASLGREARERLLSRLGIAARDRDAAQITRDRATARAVALAAHLAERTPAQRQNWRGRRLTRRLSKAIGQAAVGTDALQRARLLDQLAARRHALALATLPLPSPWSPAHSAPAAVPPQPTSKTPVPACGVHGPTASQGDRGPCAARGPVPETAGTEDGDAGTDPGTGAVETGAVPGTGHRGPEAAPSPSPADAERLTGDAGIAGARLQGQEVPAQSPDSPGGPRSAESGTESLGDRGDKAPLRRKTPTKTRAKNKGKRGRSRPQQTQRPSRELEQAVNELVQQVRPHVPGLLERDGNESVTRVQLREILRREGLKGGRNDRLSLVLQELRNQDTTRTRSTR